MAEQDAVAVIPEAPLDHHHKRKLEDIEEPSPDEAAPDSTVALDGEHKEIVDAENGDGEPAKRPRLDENHDSLASENGHKPGEDNGNAVVVAEAEAAAVESTETAVDNQAGGEEGTKEVLPEEVNEAEPVVAEGDQKVDAEGDIAEAKDADRPLSEFVPKEGAEKTSTEGAEQGDVAAEQQYPESGTKSMSRKIEIPNNKVGVLIGKSGDTIKYLQLNSGAKIQITRDADADPRSATRPVELVGSLESLNKAENLIKDVIAEADAGGSPSLVARGFTAAITAGSLEIEIPVPGDKVGLIIGRGGETIRNLQTRSGARIQLIPQNVPGDQSKEKKVKVTGDKKQVEMARELIKEVMNQIWLLPSKCGQHSFLGVSIGNQFSVSSTEERYQALSLAIAGFY